ncbi:MAG: helix-turn-helix transcriptional regulator, partial [Bacteroidota bacterium]|nr:helix-turn-helix transcriptional regulator [Bacteroidota bacterium]
RIKKYSDTCSHPLVSSYALYKIGYEPTKKSDWLILWIIVVLILLTISGVWYVFRSKQQSKMNPLSELSIQERKIFAMLKEGKSNKEIADACAISISTVKSHVNNIYSKLGVGSRKEVMDIGPASSAG